MKRRLFNSPKPPILSPYFYPPITRDYPDPTPTIFPEESNIHEVLIKEKPCPPEAPHPLVIELRCGKYVRIPWPESRILYSEEGQEAQCPDSQ